MEGQIRAGCRPPSRREKSARSEALRAAPEHVSCQTCKAAAAGGRWRQPRPKSAVRAAALAASAHASGASGARPARNFVRMSHTLQPSSLLGRPVRRRPLQNPCFHINTTERLAGGCDDWPLRRPRATRAPCRLPSARADAVAAAPAPQLRRAGAPPPPAGRRQPDPSLVTPPREHRCAARRAARQISAHASTRPPLSRRRCVSCCQLPPAASEAARGLGHALRLWLLRPRRVR